MRGCKQQTPYNLRVFKYHPQMHTNLHARKLRRQSIRPEQLLWLALRNRGIDGLKFRRQHAIGRFIADFACIERKLIVELDGAAHDIDYVRDERRDAWLKSQGFRVIRFMNEDVTRNLEGVVETIRQALLQAA